MSLKSELQKLFEEFDHYGEYGEDAQAEATDQILDLLDKSVASVKLADTYDIEGGEDPYDAYEMGFDRGIADVRKVIKEESNE